VRSGGVGDTLWPPPPAVLRATAAVLTAAALVASLIIGSGMEPSAEPTVRSFLLDWSRGDFLSAASYTTGEPHAVATALFGASQQLGAAAVQLSMGPISQHSNHADATFHASVDLGEDGAPWQYDGKIPLLRSGSGWKIEWSPAVINPGLRPGLRLAVVTVMPPRAPLLDREGEPLIRPSTAYEVGVQPDRLADPSATASQLADVTGLDPGQVLPQIMSAPSGKFTELVTLDPRTYRQLVRRLRKVPGLRVYKTTRQLSDSAAPEITGTVGTDDSPLLRQEGLPYQPGATIGVSGLEAEYQRQLAGTAMTEVVTEDSGGHLVSVLKQWPGQQGSPVRTTLDSRVQAAALSAVHSVRAAVAIAAVSPSTGDILAIAAHPARGVPLTASDVLDGRYPPGGAFTIVSTAALLGTGLSVDTAIPCAEVKDVGGKTFTNDPPETAAGTQPPFRTDFAADCATAFAGLSRLLTGNQLNTAAAGFGLGANWRLPESSFSGLVPLATDDADRAAETIGDGGVQVSPLAMALVAGDVASGGTHPPALIAAPDPGGTVPGAASAMPTASLRPGLAGNLRSLMRASVSGGAAGAAAAADLPGRPVCGQIGRSPLEAGRTWANWFVGYRGNIAFAVLEIGNPATASTNGAATLAAQFLQASPAL
jgi:cell division protein FtsI/penicillin-binding protein 2